jgi:hypothetical protein
MSGQNDMRILFALALLIFATGVTAIAQPQPIPGMIAKRETDLLTYEDKLAAYDAEQAVLSNEWSTGATTGRDRTALTGRSSRKARSRRKTESATAAGSSISFITRTTQERIRPFRAWFAGPR